MRGEAIQVGAIQVAGPKRPIWGHAPGPSRMRGEAIQVAALHIAGSRTPIWADALGGTIENAGGSRTRSSLTHSRPQKTDLAYRDVQKICSKKIKKYAILTPPGRPGAPQRRNFACGRRSEGPQGSAKKNMLGPKKHIFWPSL